MRGAPDNQSSLFSYVSLEDRIPKSHPIRKVKLIFDKALAEMDDVFESLYSSVGRASIPPEQLLRALLLQILYSIRSERQMVERLSYDMLFRWFVGLSLDDQVWHATTFTHNRDRLITSGIVNQAFTDNGLLAMSFSAKFDLSSLAYSLMSDGEKDQVNAWRRSAYLVRARYVKQIDRFPESLIASQRGVGVPPVIVLPPAELAKVEAAERDYAATKTRLSRWWLLLLLGLTAAAAWFSFRAIKIKRMQENIPTSKTAGIVYGLAEVKGKLLADESTEILTGPLSGNECTWYHYVVEEQRGSGKNKSWHVIQDEIVKRPFYCEDDEGKIRIFPGSAECITQHVETDRVGNRRYTERRLSPGDQLYVLGKAKLDKTTGETLVFGHEKGSPYIIANIPEEEVMVRKARAGMGLMAFSLSMLFLGALLLVSGNGHMSSVDFLFASLIAPAFMLFVVFVLMYNDLIFLKQRCDRNWANIQVSLKKRANLVPQLEQVVKQYLSHEAELQLDLVALRERRASANNSQNFDDYMALEHRAIAQVRARIEQYPDLEGIDLISVFNRRLIKLENEVALIRAGFNDAVTQYQIRCQTFPDNLFARTFNFPVRDLLHYTASAHRVPNVTRLKSE